MDKVIIFTGGSIDCDWAKQWLCDMDFFYCIAADKGLMYAHKMGMQIDYILGDYDSVDRPILEKYKQHTTVETFPAEKDYTDTHLALKKAVEVLSERQAQQKAQQDIPEIYILGGTGTRIDHTMTNIYCMKEILKTNFRCYMMDKYNKIYMCNKKHFIKKKEQYGNFVSILPVTEEAVITLKGMKYNLSHFCLKQGVSICQSNEVLDDTAEIIVEKGEILVYETKD